MKRNWKTTVFGILTLALTGWKIYTTGSMDAQDIAAITTGGGLIAAKDSNVTGGDIRQ